MNHHKRKGFTLIELILYVGITGTILLGVVNFIFMTSSARVKNQTIGETSSQASQIFWQINEDILAADNITSPTTGSSSTSLTLDMGGTATSYNLSGTMLQKTIGANPAEDLHSSDVEISSILFSNVSRTDTPGIVKTDIEIQHINPANQNEFDFSETFNFSTSLRN